MEASVIGLGAWVMGGGSVWGADADDAESIRAIHAALDAGINLIDTAPAYGFGRSEEVVGRALRDRRDKVLVATKCGLWWDDERGSYFCEFDGRPMRRCLRPDTIRIEVENSLRRLRTGHIDLYQTHWPAIPPEQTPVAETLGCLMDLKREGKIRAIGVCNVSADELLANLEHGEIASDQFRYSMLHREPERGILPLCREHGLATLTYMSLEQGLLTGKVGMDRSFASGEFRTNEAWNPWFAPHNRKRVLEFLDALAPVAADHHCTLAQLVLAWTAAQPGVTHVLAGGRTTRQVLENAAGGEVTLGKPTLDRIEALLTALGEPDPPAAAG